MKRRDFVGALVAGAALFVARPRIVLARVTMPVLHGDGVTDDAPAIQAMIDGQDVWDARRARVLRGAGAWLLYGSTFAIGRTIYCDTRPEHLPVGAIDHCWFRSIGSAFPMFAWRLRPQHNYRLAD